MAEDGGFEPPDGCPHVGFLDRCVTITLIFRMYNPAVARGNIVSSTGLCFSAIPPKMYVFLNEPGCKPVNQTAREGPRQMTDFRG